MDNIGKATSSSYTITIDPEQIKQIKGTPITEFASMEDMTPEVRNKDEVLRDAYWFLHGVMAVKPDQGIEELLYKIQHTGVKL